MTERQKKIAKIKALLAKTVENGCTEEEMNAALALARKLMDDYEIDDTDIQFGGESVTVETVVKTDFDKIRGQLADAVGRFCHCVGWKTGKSSDTINYCGLQSEVVFAHWMLDMLADFVLFQCDLWLKRSYRRGMPRVRRIERGSFIVGCTNRIVERLQQLTPRHVGTGKDLIVLRNSLIDQHMEARGIKLRDMFKLFRGDADAYDAGEAAGDHAQFNRPVDGRAERRLLQ